MASANFFRVFHDQAIKQTLQGFAGSLGQPKLNTPLIPSKNSDRGADVRIVVPTFVGLFNF